MGGKELLAAERNNSITALEALYEFFFPKSACLDSHLRMRRKKDLKISLLQPLGTFFRHGLVLAAVADEDGDHRRIGLAASAGLHRSRLAPAPGFDNLQEISLSAQRSGGLRRRPGGLPLSPAVHQVHADPTVRGPDLPFATEGSGLG